MSRTLSSETQPTMPLHDLERVDANRFALRIMLRLGLNLSNFFGCQHDPFRHRSMSASTKSRLPKITTKSGIIRPCDNQGSVCMWANDGVRMRVR